MSVVSIPCFRILFNSRPTPSQFLQLLFFWFFICICCVCASHDDCSMDGGMSKDALLTLVVVYFYRLCLTYYHFTTLERSVTRCELSKRCVWSESYDFKVCFTFAVLCFRSELLTISLWFCLFCRKRISHEDCFMEWFSNVVLLYNSQNVKWWSFLLLNFIYTETYYLSDLNICVAHTGIDVSWVYISAYLRLPWRHGISKNNIIFYVHPLFNRKKISVHHSWLSKAMVVLIENQL